jgi:heavy metal sensor kinase
VLFIVFGVFSYATLQYHLEKDLREALARRARQVADTTQRSSTNWDALGVAIHDHFAPEANSRLTRVAANGTLAYLSGPPVDQSFDPRIVPPAPEGTLDESFARRTMPDGKVLFVVSLLRTIDNKPHVIEEGFSAAPIDTALRERLIALLAVLCFLVLAAVVGGYLLVQRSLAPVDHIIKSAEQITLRKLNDRLPVSKTGDELERLSVSLNNMIGRLDAAFQQTQRFLADASHELRTPLTILHGELEALVERNAGKTEVRETAGSALEEVQRLKKIVETLFALSRLDAGEAQEESVAVDLGELATTTADQMYLLAEDKHIAIVHRCSQNIFVKGDRARLKQVLVNLLDNAIKYTQNGGKIEISLTARDGKAFLKVSDNGIGIPSADLAHVFERFFRADKARSREMGGAGLGLSIVRSICTAHHGRVEVQSEEGQGSQFIVELPLIQKAIP